MFLFAHLDSSPHVLRGCTDNQLLSVATLAVVTEIAIGLLTLEVAAGDVGGN